MVHINLRKGHTATIEASGDPVTIAGQLTAAVGVIYAHLCGTGTSAGDTFREAVTSMMADSANIWTESLKVKAASGGYSVVFELPDIVEG